MKIHIRTYGCQMNMRDSEAVGSLLRRHGYELTDAEKDADIVIVNTCSVRAKAEDKAVGKMRLLIDGRKEGNNRVVGAIGCMAQRLAEDLLRDVKGIDFVVGTHRLSAVPYVVETVLAGKGPVVDVEHDGESPAESGDRDTEGVSSFVTVLRGCDRCCSYCIVPFVRGPEKSRPAVDIIREVERLAAGGVKEVTLLGQSVMSYGRRRDVWQAGPGSAMGFTEPFSRLLEAVASIPGLERVRFTSAHPSGCTDELAAAVGKLPAVCEHVHMALQSGCDRILEMMGRGYSVEEYREAVARLRSAAPDMAVTTDIIVGFPSETPEEFDMTRRVMEEIGFDNAFIFKYSPRPGTKALQWRDDVSGEEKMRRNRVLLEEQNLRGRKINERLVGSVVEVLVSGVSPRNPDRWCGRTRTNKITVFKPSGDEKPGDLVGVGLDRAMPQTLYGRLVRES